jgi:NADH:ubiquinone reductase (H+-translocating)
MHQIIVVGGGAGGLELATRLGDKFGSLNKTPRARIILVDRNPTHIWKPLLHEVAAGSMDPFTHQLEYAAQARWHGFEFQQGELAGLDRAAKTITVGTLIDREDGEELLPQRVLSYDTLVIAIGSTTHFFGVSGAQEHALALDTVWQAERFRRRLIATCMRAQSQPTAVQAGEASARGRVEIAIIGGGATGVELSAELRATAKVLASYGLHQLDPQHDIGITLIEAGPRVLPALPERVSVATTELLAKLGVAVRTDQRVLEVSPTALRTASEETIRADLTVWAAGIKAPEILAQLGGLEVNPLGQLNVRATLQTTHDDDVFALGDCAACAWPEENRTVPPRAQAAHQQASFLLHALQARLDGASLPEFRYRDFGSLVSLGHFSAVGNLMGGVIGGSMLIEGLFARFMYMSLYRLHIAALHGWPRMVLDTVAHWLRRSTMPRVKLH